MRFERLVAICFAVSTLAGVGLIVVYALEGQPQLEGSLLAIALGGVGVGLIVWARKVLPPRHRTERRRHWQLGTHAPEALDETLDEGIRVLTRRRQLVWLLATAAGALGLAALFPIRSLGPGPGDALVRTPWRRGMRLLAETGRLLSIHDLEVDSFITVFPEGHQGSADGQAVLFRVEPSTLRLPPHRLRFAPDGFIAYSKVCTHAGCPLGLYLAATHELRCPCHQSTFDILDGARPIYGPAPRPLPQLPLMIDAEGAIRAVGDFTEPVGPSFWDLS
jgi:ubiquinol-cytochrome c reductase iron-sulfur subunit